MEDKNCELLFEYLRSILYDPNIQQLDIEKLDEPYRKLGMGLQFLQQAVEELQTYSADLSRGNLSGPYPSRDNFLCVNLKSIHANLNHLTWQAKQVAAGDYSQHVSYLGQFSEAFNTMTAQLKEREAQLKEEAAKAEQRADMIEGYNELLVEMTRKRREWILVVDSVSRDIVYCNKRQDEKEVNPSFCGICKYRLTFLEQILTWQDSEQFKIWEVGDEVQGFYRITSFPIEWRSKSACAHIVVEITDEKRETSQLTNKAYYDPGTGIRNRLFFEERMEKLLRERTDITLCYLDLDGLKYVNDKYGHNEGDRYIRSFVATIQNSFRSTDVFARIGGDEFCLILPKANPAAVERKFARILERFAEENDREYAMSFSYGVIGVDGHKNTRNLEELIKAVDARMYRCKGINKEKYHRR